MARSIIRLPRVKAKSGLCRTGIYDGMAEGTFPQSVPLGPRAVGWIEDEVDEWVEARIAARDRAKNKEERIAESARAGPRKRAVPKINSEAEERREEVSAE